MSRNGDEGELTRLLKRWSEGDAKALDELMPLVFAEVRDLARKALDRESSAHTLQPTALVHEVYLHLHGRRTVSWENRGHFFATLIEIIRRLLVDHARHHRAAKRGGDAVHLPLAAAMPIAAERPPPDFVALDEALKALEAIDPRRCRVVELKFFMGFTEHEIAEALEVSVNTVRRDWQSAKVWLYGELRPESERA